MSYDATKDPFKGTSRDSESFGNKSRTVTRSDSVDLNTYAKLLVTVGGTLVVLPVENADVDTVNLGTVAAGFIPPFNVRRVMLTGTTATVITIDV